MKDLIPCTAARDDFRQWLVWGHAPMTVYKGEKAVAMMTRLEKSPSVEYLYQTAIERDGSVSWNNGLTFCGVSDLKNNTLYLTKGTLDCLADGQAPLVTETGPSMVERITSRINQQVEDTIANDQGRLPVQELTDWKALRDIQYYQEYGAKESAIRQFFDGMEPDAQFHSGYTLDGLPEAAFLVYIQDPEGFVQTEAEKYIKTNQEKLLLQFLKKDALLAEYQVLIQDTESPIHRMKAITDAVKASGAKTVTVTVQKDGTELTFKALASSLTGHRNYYSTYDIPAQGRREFERLFGRSADYHAEEISKITYGRNTIYEAPPVQTVDLAEGQEMGGMRFG